METPREIWVIESKLKKNSGGWWPQADKIYQEKRFAKVGLDELKQEFKHFDFRMVRYLPDGKGKD
ncbi:MAG: hypothetical protein ACE5ER_08895 [Nitrospinaceae bacterium]